MTNNENKSDKQVLPLIVEKKNHLKIFGIVALVFVIIGFNLFVLQKDDKKDKAKKAEERYSIASVNPLTHGQINIQGETENATLNEAKLKQQLAEAKAKDFIDRLQASQTVGGNHSSPNVQGGGNINQVSPSGEGVAYSQNENTAFLEHANQATPDRSFASNFAPRPYLIGQGKFIFGTLAVAINSDLPGQISAITSQDVYSEQGRHVLIPKGSRLIGEYRSGLSTNQSRLFVVWTRVITTTGLSVMLGSTGTDALGRAGLTGDVNYHFFARFGSASLISLIGAGVSTVGINPNDEYNSKAAYREAVSKALANQSTTMLGQSINIPPTIEIAQGEKIVIFVNKDLDFSRVYR